MAFDKSLPSDTTKIRNYPTVLTSNFAGIQEGVTSFRPWSVNLADRTADAVVPVTPARIDNTMIVYSKNDGSQTELFVLDDQNPANDLQVTQNGRMGSTATKINASDISFDDTERFTSDNFVTAWGYFDNTGALLTGQRMQNATKNGTGDFTVKTTAVFNNANVCVIGTPFRPSSNTPSSLNVYTAPSLAASVVSVDIEVKGRDGSHKDTSFYVAIIGGI